MKKFLSLMMLALVAMAAKASITVYVQANDAPYLYVWDDSELKLNGEWPGTQLTETAEVKGVTFWKATFDAESINIIFNNGSGSQTGDITGITEDVYYTYDGDETATEYEFPVEYTVTFVNGLSWTNVYAYAWTGDDDSATPIAAWPGTQIEKTGTTTIGGLPYDVYSYTFSATAAPEKIIFNNNGDEQTADLTFEADKQYPWYPIELTKRINNWDFTGCSNGNFPGWTIYNPKNGNAWKNGDSFVEYWIGTAVNGDFDYYQTVNSLPAGKYTLSARMWNSSNNVSGDAPNGNAGVYGTSGDVTVFKGVTTESTNASLVTETTDAISVLDGTLRLGVKNNGTMGARWFGVDWIKLTYTEPVDISEYVAIYTAKKAEATALLNETMSASYKAALQAAVDANTGVDETSQEALEAAIAALTEAIATANISVNSYKLLAAGGLLPDNSLDGWTCTNSQTFHINTWSVEGNSDGTGMVTPFIENWCYKDGVLGDGEIYYTLPGLEPGIYKFSALIRAYSESGNAPDGASLFAGDREIAFATGNNFEYNNMKGIYDNYAMTAEVGEDGVFKFGVKIASANFNWMAFKTCKVEYVGAAITAESVDALYAEMPEGKMNKDVRSAAEAAYTAAKADVSLNTYEALDKAIVAANASATAYAAAIANLDKVKAEIDAELAGTNVYTQDSYDAVITNNYTKYEAEELTDTEANDLANAVSGTSGTTWRAPFLIDNILLSAWDTNPDFVDAPYYINSWSTEGNNDGTNFKVPFFEYYTDANKALSEKTMTATMTGLTPGTYQVSAWVRVATIENAGEAEGQGISMQLNDGIAVDVFDGDTKVAGANSNQRIHGNFTALGSVGEDGVLNIKFIVAADNNIHWLSFKNVKFEAYTPEKYYVAGGFNTTVGNTEDVIFGTSWDPAVNEMMAEGDGTYTYIKPEVQLEAGTIWYKVAADGDWSINWGFDGNNADYVVNDAGTYDVVFRFNPSEVLENGYNVACYLKEPGTATAITTVNAAKQAEAIYNMAGQQVKNAQKGIFIQNGKKVVKK